MSGRGNDGSSGQLGSTSHHDAAGSMGLVGTRNGNGGIDARALLLGDGDVGDRGVVASAVILVEEDEGAVLVVDQPWLPGPDVERDEVGELLLLLAVVQEVVMVLLRLDAGWLVIRLDLDLWVTLALDGEQATSKDENLRN